MGQTAKLRRPGALGGPRHPSRSITVATARLAVFPGGGLKH